MRFLKLINFICFQLAWFACVLGAAHGIPWLGVAVTALILAWHFYVSTANLKELKLILIIVLMGGIFDQGMLTSQLIQYQNTGWGELNSVVPVWILALWAGFASSLNVSLRWMRNKIFIAILFGLVGAPLAYICAQKLGAVVVNGTTSIVILGIGWGVLMPIFLKLSERFDGFTLKT